MYSTWVLSKISLLNVELVDNLLRTMRLQREFKYLFYDHV